MDWRKLYFGKVSPSEVQESVAADQVIYEGYVDRR